LGNICYWAGRPPNHISPKVEEGGWM
jgi:hypothetical protein